MKVAVHKIIKIRRGRTCCATRFVKRRESRIDIGTRRVITPWVAHLSHSLMQRSAHDGHVPRVVRWDEKIEIFLSLSLSLSIHPPGSHPSRESIEIFERGFRSWIAFTRGISEEASPEIEISLRLPDFVFSSWGQSFVLRSVSILSIRIFFILFLALFGLENCKLILVLYICIRT